MLSFQYGIYTEGFLYSRLCGARSVLSSVVCIKGFSKLSNYSAISRYLKGIKRVLLNRALISTQLHPLPPRSIHLHPAYFSHHSALCNTLNVIRTKISRNWAISPNLGRKTPQSCPFSLKIGTYGILEMLIPNSDLDFWNPDPKIHFGQTWGEKAESPFCLKIGKHGY